MDAQTFAIPTGPGGARVPVSEAQFKTYWANTFRADPEMQRIFNENKDRPGGESSKERAATMRAVALGWVPPNKDWSIDFDKKSGSYRTELGNAYTRNKDWIDPILMGLGVGGLGALGAAGAGGAGAAGAAGAGAGAGEGAGVGATVAATSPYTIGYVAGAGGAAGAGAGAGAGAAAVGAGLTAAQIAAQNRGTGNAPSGSQPTGTTPTTTNQTWADRLGKFAKAKATGGTGTTGGGITEAGRIISGMAEGRAKGRLSEEQIMAIDANLRMNAAKTQADLYNEARRNSIRGKLLSDAPTDYAGMVPANVRAFSGTSPTDTSRNPALGKQLQDDAAGVLAKGPGSYDASSVPPPPYAGKLDTALNWLGTGLQLYGAASGGWGGDGGGDSTAGLDPYAGSASSPADNAANMASMNDKMSQVTIQPPTIPDIPSITLPPYSESMPTDANIMAGTRFQAPLDPFLANSVYRVPRSGVRF